MIYTERTVKVKNGTASIDSPIILYRGDREVEVLFTIKNSLYKFSAEKGNYIDDTKAKWGQLAIDLPDGNDTFTDISECVNGSVLFKITGEMIDELHEVGFYSFHIRLYNEDMTSRITIPPIIEGIEIREPIVIEDDVNESVAMVGYGMVDRATINNEELEFDDYLDIIWKKGDVISSTRLNQMVQYINEKAVPGEQGPQGEQGEKGEQGEQGPQGEKGEQGPQGEKGDQGEPGKDGAAFTYDMFTQEQLEALRGPQGEQGPPGEGGSQGEQGLQSPGVRMIAHRGYNVDIPENSIPAFESAGLRGYWGAECDVVQTGDGHFVLMHDETIDRTTNGSGSVKELTLEEIKSYSIDTHAKFNGLKVPTLEEYIICCRRYNLIPIMEIKGDINVEQFYQIIKDYNIEDKCVVISFSNIVLEALRSLSSIIKIQTLSFVSFEHCIKYNFDIDIDRNTVTADFIKDAHDMRLKVNVWTVNADINNYIDMGVDYITTDSLSTRTNVGNRLVAIEEDANCNNAVSNTLSYLGKDISTSNELCICKLYHGNRSWNKAIYYYPDDFYKVSYNSVRLISDIYSHRGYSTCSLMYDDSKYKAALYFFDMSDSHLLKDSGWLSSNIEYKLDDTDSYFALFIARTDGATFTESDINELKSNFKVVFDKDSLVEYSTKEDMTQNDISNNVLTLTKDKYQECKMLDGTEIVLPTLDTYEEIHLFFSTTADIAIVMPNGLKYQQIPTILANKTYEFIFTYTNTSKGWVFGYIEYEG